MISFRDYPSNVTTNTTSTITATAGHAYITMIYNSIDSAVGIDFPHADDNNINDFAVGGGAVLNFGDHPLKVKQFDPGNAGLVVVWYNLA